ncbi:MAG: SurA N-terminal domain-containing protein [Gammaproteobacteria bacterium]|nr:SurA N-terminal domain-containing protein [Gammaproteobacteria bacterium]
MLQSIRDRAQGWLAWIIVGLIIIPFALWGVQEYEGAGAGVNVATVNGVDITQQRFQRVYDQQRQRLRAQLGGDFNSQDETRIKQTVLDNLIRDEVIRQTAEALKLRVSNAQLAQEVGAIPQFQENGQFSPQLFQQALRAQGLSPEGLESQLRQGLIMEQLNTGVTVTSIITPAELDQAIRIKNQQRDIGYLVLPWASFKEGVNPDEGAVQKYYEQNREQLASPEQVSIEYIELSAQALASQIILDEQELHKLYEEHAATYATPEQRRASHILITVDKAADEAAVTAAKAKAEEIRQRLIKGEDFAKVAKEVSQDPGSAPRGGDLGFFGKGAMDKAFEDRVFSLKAGELSEPVRSTFGFHIIKLAEIKPAVTKGFAEVRPDLVKELQQRKTQQMFFEKTEPLTNLSFENPDTLAVASKELGLPIQSSDLFDRKGGEGITSNPKVVTAAFSEDILKRGFNSEPIETGDNRLVVLRVKEHKPAAQRSLEEVRQTIVEQLRTEMAQAKARAAGEVFMERLKKGEDPAAIAKEYRVEWVKSGLIGRDETKINPQIVRAAFRLNKPAKDALPAVGGESLESGDYAVPAVYAVREGDPAGMESAARTALKRELQRNLAQSEYDLLVAEAKNEAKIVIHPDKL